MVIYNYLLGNKFGGYYILYVKFEDDAVKELFDDLNDVTGSRNLMKRKIGAELTRAVKKRYNQMIAFSSFLSLFQSHIGKMESLQGANKGSYSLTVSANYRLIIKPDTMDLSAESLKKCDTFIIEGVIDYHGKGSKNNWIIP
ncbi:MAG: type II toxin-antitoxin system RelE/ParE family toxin [Eubacterium sp.]|nr:type II toxin-antitoxin system RelE/ParE family toxin [Eubacterium sp.]